ncbi:four helix bundle protein [Flavobacterium antarcticum]|uniref:four helix bundle protein n=1 Tax=Flavobacterium antarcticum TaxID=271155 RepID=UPI0003B3B4D0|nr:four helix bundle protein [Flavobacterium antarcticum]
MHNYKELEIWKASLTICTPIYRLTKTFPDDEKFGLISQIRRAAVSVPSNIAEGSSRNSDKDFVRFLEYSLGSCREIETQILIAQDLEYASPDTVAVLLKEIYRIMVMINNFIKKLRSNY